MKMFIRYSCYLIIIILGFSAKAISNEQNTLNIIFFNYSCCPGDSSYQIRFSANKIGATTCELKINQVTYPCKKILLDCRRNINNLVGVCDTADELFLAEDLYENYRDLSLSQMKSKIENPWTLTWDKGLATESIVTINFGIVNEDDFYPIPYVFNPENGQVDVLPNTSLEWNYRDISYENAQKESVKSVLYSMEGGGTYPADIPLSSASWSPPSPLSNGKWLFLIDNNRYDFRCVSDGVGDGVDVSGDPWLLDNSSWLTLTSGGSTLFTVASDQGLEDHNSACFISAIL